jgi:transposase-like protein
MRKNQKYSKEEMYLAIELWQESGLSQVKFCSRENLSVKTFSYWYKKYKNENRLSVEENRETPNTFIPVKVSGDRTANVSDGEYGRIEVSFPNGVQVSCPVGIDIGQLKSLINF